MTDWLTHVLQGPSLGGGALNIGHQAMGISLTLAAFFPGVDLFPSGNFLTNFIHLSIQGCIIFLLVFIIWRLAHIRFGKNSFIKGFISRNYFPSTSTLFWTYFCGLVSSPAVGRLSYSCHHANGGPHVSGDYDSRVFLVLFYWHIPRFQKTREWRSARWISESYTCGYYSSWARTFIEEGKSSIPWVTNSTWFIFIIKTKRIMSRERVNKKILTEISQSHISPDCKREKRALWIRDCSSWEQVPGRIGNWYMTIITLYYVFGLYGLSLWLVLSDKSVNVYFVISPAVGEIRQVIMFILVFYFVFYWGSRSWYQKKIADRRREPHTGIAGVKRKNGEDFPKNIISGSSWRKAYPLIRLRKLRIEATIKRANNNHQVHFGSKKKKKKKKKQKKQKKKRQAVFEGRRFSSSTQLFQLSGYKIYNSWYLWTQLMFMALNKVWKDLMRNWLAKEVENRRERRDENQLFKRD